MSSQYLNPRVQANLNLSKPALLSQWRMDSKLLSFGDCHSYDDNCHWNETHGSVKASQVFPVYMSVNFTISTTNFLVTPASSSREDKCQLGVSLPVEPGGFTKAWGLFVDEQLLAEPSISPSLPCTNCFAQAAVCTCIFIQYTAGEEAEIWQNQTLASLHNFLGLV